MSSLMAGGLYPYVEQFQGFIQTNIVEKVFGKEPYFSGVPEVAKDLFKEAIPAGLAVFAGYKVAMAFEDVKERNYSQGGLKAGCAVASLASGLLLSASKEIAAISLTAAIVTAAATVYNKNRVTPDVKKDVPALELEVLESFSPESLNPVEIQTEITTAGKE
jgi:hypothetical protein